MDQDACLKAHNDKRKLHDTSPLVWDAELAKDAQAWANHLLGLGYLTHAPVSDDQGENLYMSISTVPTDATCSQAVEAW